MSCCSQLGDPRDFGTPKPPPPLQRPRPARERSRVIQVCDRATFVFDSRVDIPKGVFQSVPLELVDTRGWDEAVLTVVKHAGSSFTTGNLLVAAFQAAHKAEDPSVDFTGTDIAQLWMEYGTLAPLQTARLSVSYTHLTLPTKRIV